MTKSVLETFYSIQGEGLKIGVPSVFVRFAGCNLRCSWCDTKYAWEEEPELTLNDVKSFIEKTECFEVVITGGEPLLNQDLILNLVSNLYNKNFTIETNGTILPCEWLRLRQNILFSVSPKLFLEKWDRYINIFDSLQNVQFKFVITDIENDLEKISRLNLKHPIIVQPNGEKSPYSEACRELAEAVIEKQLSYRVLPQFHKICWQDRRGI